LEQLLGNADDAADTSADAKQQSSLLSQLPEDVRESLRFAQLLDKARTGEPIYLMPFRLRIK
jgi:hypothetical protein